MGTNYYWESGSEKDCPTCGKSKAEKIHIGKKSAGWVFSLHVDESNGIDSIVDWIDLFSEEGSVITNEYGSIIDPINMIRCIVSSSSTDSRSLNCQSELGRWDLVHGEFC